MDRIIPAVLCIFERRVLYFYISVQHLLLRLYLFRLALYVYEYLLHVGAQKSAQTFLSEVRIMLVLQASLILFVFAFYSLDTL